MNSQRLCLLLLFAAWNIHAQNGMDLDVLNKWSKFKTIRWTVTGVHQARALVVSGDHEGKGDIVDRVTLEFVWEDRTRKPVGAIKITDAKSEVKNLKSDGTNCAPPTLRGDYEHFQSGTHSVSAGGDIQIKGTRTFPAASVSQWPASCGQKAIPGAAVEVSLFVGSPQVRMLGMPLQTGSKAISVAPDRKSYTIKGAENWVWTYTPAAVQ